MSNALLEDLRWRGLVAQCTDEVGLAARLEAGPVSVYAGFDPTAASLHVGNLIPLIALARFQRAGHRGVALVGGATGLIGDPSGKGAERLLQTPDEVAVRTKAIQTQLASVVNSAAGLRQGLEITRQAGSLAGDFTLEGVIHQGARVVNNLDWTADVSMLDFLRDVGKHFSVNAMIHRDSVKSRLDRDGEGISFTEFSYMLLQAHDFLRLAEREGCELQIGGSDQWGNMCSGVDLIRRKLDRQAFALTFPLLTTHDGQKFGKSVKGAVWLDAAQTSVWDFYQFWLNADDHDVIRLLKLFTFVSRPEIEEYAVEVETAPQRRLAQRRLAFEMTKLIHGKDAAGRAVAAARVLFEKAEPAMLSVAAWEDLLHSVPNLKLPSLGDVPALAALLVAAGLEVSNSRALDSIRAGGVSINNVKITDPRLMLSEAHLLQGRYALIRKGKKHFAIVAVG